MMKLEKLFEQNSKELNSHQHNQEKIVKIKISMRKRNKPHHNISIDNESMPESHAQKDQNITFYFKTRD